MKKSIGKYLKEVRLKAGLSLVKLGKMADISDVHVMYIENEKRAPTFNVLVRLLKALKIEWDDFLKDTGYIPTNIEPAKVGKLRSIPVISWVMAGKWQDVCDVFQPNDADEFVKSDVKGQHVFALRVKGDSMEPEFLEGDIIIINPHLNVNFGDYVIVKNRNGDATFKQLKKYGNTFVLHPLNPKYPDMEVKKCEFQIIGKVVEKKKKY